MQLVSVLITWFVATAVINAYLMTLPMLDRKGRDYPPKFQIRKNNRIDIQKNHECAAYSTAYVLRHYGIEADGSELYKVFPGKMKSGCVYPKGIRTYLKLQGFKTSFLKGNLCTLKKQIAKGNPVIVFMKVHANRNELHYACATGYDQDYIYLAESLPYLVNCSGGYGNYNRKVHSGEFAKLWDVKRLHMPLYSCTYITVDC